MAKTVDIELSKAEIELLHGLVQDNVDSGTYWGNKHWFYVMQAGLSEKLEEAYAELENEV